MYLLIHIFCFPYITSTITKGLVTIGGIVVPILRQRLFLYRKRSSPFLMVDASNGNQAMVVMIGVIYSLDSDN